MVFKEAGVDLTHEIRVIFICVKVLKRKYVRLLLGPMTNRNSTNLIYSQKTQYLVGQQSLLAYCKNTV